MPNENISSSYCESNNIWKLYLLVGHLNQNSLHWSHVQSFEIDIIDIDCESGENSNAGKIRV